MKNWGDGWHVSYAIFCDLFLLFVEKQSFYFVLISILVLGRTPALEKASKSVWELILDSNGLGKEISTTVERVFCRLSGREPPLFPEPNTDAQPGKENGKGKAKEDENEHRKENSGSTSKKRTFAEMNSEGGADEVASKTRDPPSAPEEFTKPPSPGSTT